MTDSWVAWYETIIPAVILGGLSGTVHLPHTCQAALAQCCSGSTPASAGCLWDRGPITSRWGSLISIPGPVKATQLCTAATILSGLAAGLFKVIAFSYTDDRQNKYSLFFYWGAFGLLHSCLICIVLPCFLLGFLVYDVVRFDCVVLQLIREKVEGGRRRRWRRVEKDCSQLRERKWWLLLDIKEKEENLTCCWRSHPKKTQSSFSVFYSLLNTWVKLHLASAYVQQCRLFMQCLFVHD